MDGERLVPLGRIQGPYGVQGWVRIHSSTEPPEAILGYRPWLVAEAGGWRRRMPVDGRMHGTGLVARLEGVDDRDLARELAGADIAVERHRLPALPPGEYYWCDLLGLEVETRAARSLGRVTSLLETGANDVLVVSGDRERLVPFLPDQVVLEVDLSAGRIRVDWDPDF
jgi:16S rRNA processing protein RimM